MKIAKREGAGAVQKMGVSSTRLRRILFPPTLRRDDAERYGVFGGRRAG
jgi:hypothetical protein